MAEASNPVAIAASLLAGAAVLRVQAWRAWLFLNPRSVTLHAEEPAEQLGIPAALEAQVEALKASGFVLVGSHSEHSRLRDALTCIDLLHAETGTWASVFDAQGKANVLLLNRGEKAWLMSANFRRGAREFPGAFIGTLPGVPGDRLFRAHVRRLADIGAVGPQTASLDARLELGRAWCDGPGARDLRSTHAMGALWAVGGLGLLAAPFIVTWL